MIDRLIKAALVLILLSIAAMALLEWELHREREEMNKSALKFNKTQKETGRLLRGHK